MPETREITKNIKCWPCAACLAPIWLDAETESQFRRTGEVFHCLNGCQNHFGKGEADKLRAELAAEQAEKKRAMGYLAETERQLTRALQAVGTEKRSKAAIAGHLTRLRNRVKAGQCPCCDREFPDLAAHIAAEHPDVDGMPGTNERGK